MHRSDSVRAPDAQYVDQLMGPADVDFNYGGGAPAPNALAHYRRTGAGGRQHLGAAVSVPSPPAAAAAAGVAVRAVAAAVPVPSALPLIALKRVINPEIAHDFRCVAAGPACTDDHGEQCLPHEVVLTGCGHTICRGCWTQHRTFARGSSSYIDEEGAECIKCPLKCDEGTSMELGARGNPAMMKRLWEATVVCEFGCGAQYKIGANFGGEVKHRAQCTSRREPCTHCRELVHVGKMQEHLAVCVDLPLPCEQCEERVASKDFAAHLGAGASCAGMTSCADCAEALPRSKLDGHRARCAQRKVSCVFGCSEQLLQADVKRHNKKRSSRHLEALMERISKQQKQIEGLQERGVPFKAFPGYTRIYQDVFRFNYARVFAKQDGCRNFPVRNPGNGNTDNVALVGIEVTKDNPPHEVVSTAAVEPYLEISEIRPSRPVRNMVVRMRLLRPMQVGDTETLEGMCLDESTELATFHVAFDADIQLISQRWTGIPRSSVVKLFEEHGRRMLNHKGEVAFSYELYEKLDAAVAWV